MMVPAPRSSAGHKMLPICDTNWRQFMSNTTLKTGLFLGNKMLPICDTKWCQLIINLAPRRDTTKTPYKKQHQMCCRCLFVHNSNVPQHPENSGGPNFPATPTLSPELPHKPGAPAPSGLSSLTRKKHCENDPRIGAKQRKKFSQKKRLINRRMR